MVSLNPYARTHVLQRSFDLLCDYLNFGEDFPTGRAGLVRHVLCGSLIRPSFDEYTRDYLLETEEVEDVDYCALQSLCLGNNASTSMKYSSSSATAAVDKSSWSAVDHAVRFVVRTLQCSWREGGPWDHGSWDLDSDESDIELWQVWMILRHLQAEWEAANIEDWSAESLNEMFNQPEISPRCSDTRKFSEDRRGDLILARSK